MWPVRLDLAAAERMRDLAGIDPVTPGSGWLEKLNSGPEPLVDALYAVLQPVADRFGVDDVRFAKLMQGPGVLKDAAEALNEAVEAFLPLREETEEALKAAEEQEGGPPPAKPLPEGWRMVWEFAGYVGVPPGPLTLRELLWMTRGRKELDSRNAWAPASQAISAAYLAAGVRIPPDEINPWERAAPPEAPPTGFVDP